MLTIILKKEIAETDTVTLNDFYKILDSNPLMDKAMKSLNNQVRMQDEYKEHNNQLLQMKSKRSFTIKNGDEFLGPTDKRELLVHQLDQKQDKLKPGMRLVQKLLILKQIVADVKLFAPTI